MEYDWSAVEKKESKKKVGCRIFVGLCILGTCALVVIAAIVLAAIFIPRAPNITTVGFGFEAFSVNFCPAQGKNNSACCDVNQCTFTYQTNNMNVVPYITLRVANGNLFNITANNIQASLQYTSSIVAAVNTTMSFGPQTTQDYRVYLTWDNTLPVSTMRQVMCQLSKANSNIITMTVNVKMQSVQYFLNQLQFPSRSDVFSTSVDACGTNGCVVDTNYQSSLCQ
ncbi:hypothetical protein C9374_010378 [Naegleria lovaniensis]|uniref:Uncharacterized protein n=1 Tax=Naegleria lovaniensis TaxID=51637 RepID=A0AA88KG40_NAELO|nr:uncharacterized protein C9374_010378 [Naegleria lovaniensis]KAG2375004.1 hypothetical protein C9374_010378 [Naegleria lovaniensis]